MHGDKNQRPVPPVWRFRQKLVRAHIGNVAAIVHALLANGIHGHRAQGRVHSPREHLTADGIQIAGNRKIRMIVSAPARLAASILRFSVPMQLESGDVPRLALTLTEAGWPTRQGRTYMAGIAQQNHGSQGLMASWITAAGAKASRIASSGPCSFHNDKSAPFWRKSLPTFPFYSPFLLRLATYNNHTYTAPCDCKAP